MTEWLEISRISNPAEHCKRAIKFLSGMEDSTTTFAKLLQIEATPNMKVITKAG